MGTKHWAEVGCFSHGLLGNGRIDMRIADAYRALIIAEGAGAAIALTGGVADGAKTGRSAAMERRIARAQAETPSPSGPGGQDRRRALYTRCMAQAGYLPYAPRSTHGGDRIEAGPVLTVSGEARR
jgi:hypothetical protein